MTHDSCGEGLVFGQVSIPQRGSPAPLLRPYDVRWAHCAVAAADLLLCCSDGDRAGEMAVSGEGKGRERKEEGGYLRKRSMPHWAAQMIGAKYGALPIVRQLARQQYSRSAIDSGVRWWGAGGDVERGGGSSQYRGY